MDTLYALSSGALPAGIAVVRISGTGTRKALTALCGDVPEPRKATLTTIRRPADGAILDRGLVLWFPGSRSFTGEDMAELHLHGSRAIVSAVFEVLAGEGLMLAEPGAFTRRAFDNDKLDLTEVEGLADLIAAETEVQRRQAMQQAEGELAARAGDWRERLIGLRADIEARLDFSDESDVTESLPEGFGAAVTALRGDMAEALQSAAAGERVREGFKVAILGRPNAGKSSLLNALARRDVAIVTAEAGTTRDVLEVPLDLSGYPVVLFDTAGLREAASEAEREGVRRAQRTAAGADLLLWLEDCCQPTEPPPDVPGVPMWRLATKIDLLEPSAAMPDGISVKSGGGMDRLVARLGEAAARSLGSGAALVTRQRQSEAIAAAVAALTAIDGTEDEITADLLRSASEAIARLSGRIDVESVLDRLFGEFCIGK